MCAFNGKVHWYFALFVWVGIQMGVHDHFLNPIPYMLGAMIPDADHPRAPIGRFIPLHWFFKHRGFTHTLWGLISFSFIMGCLFGVKWGCLFAGGYFIHLALDSGTPMGVKWLTGHKKRRKAV